MDIEQIFCVYCKQVIDQDLSINYHYECKQMVQNYNKHLSIKVRSKLKNKNLSKYSFHFLYYRNIAYRLVYAIGGINVGFILLYQIIIGF